MILPMPGCGGTLSGRDISTFPNRHYSSRIYTRPFQRQQVSRRSFRCSFLASTRRRVVFHHLKFPFQVVHPRRDLPQTTSRPAEVISIWVAIGDLRRIAGNESLWQAVGLSLSFVIVWKEECSVSLIMGRTRDSEYVLDIP